MVDISNQTKRHVKLIVLQSITLDPTRRHFPISQFLLETSNDKICIVYYLESNFLRANILLFVILEDIYASMHRWEKCISIFGDYVKK